MRITIKLSKAVRAVRLAVTRARYPDFDDRQALARLILEDYGVDLPPAR